MRVGSSGSLSYLPSDGLGSVDEALDGYGQVTCQAFYTPSGTQHFMRSASPASVAVRCVFEDQYIMRGSR
ncbi:MAG TPA: hypothetical protein VF120_08425 [Ktedonobacterales bacterium]